MRILISGGGIGGLSAALCLQKAGHSVKVFEQSSSFKQIGAGLQCGANAVHVLDYLGLMDKLEAVSVNPQRVEFRDAITGRVLYGSEWGDTYERRYGAPYLHVHRADLHTNLLGAFQQDKDNSIETNASVSDFKESDNAVEVSLDDGRAFLGDCLIGADGIKSLIRKKLLQQQNIQSSAPKFTGNVAWRGVVSVDRLPINFMDKVASNFMGQKKHMVIYYLRNQRLVNFVGVVEKPQPQSEGGHSWVSKAPWQQLKDDFAGWHPIVQTVIDAMDKDQCYQWDLYHHKPLSNWSSKRVTLLGDAAHATLPFMAAGAGLAIEDARVLQRALDSVDKVDQAPNLARALKLYQRNRFARTAEVQATSVKMGKLYHLQNPWLLKLAFAALANLGKSKESLLPSYNANTISLS